MKKALPIILALILVLGVCIFLLLLPKNAEPPAPETDPPTVPSTEHVHNYEAVVTPPSCTQQGITTHTCSCGDSYTTDPVDMIEHNYQETTRQEPTATQDGSVTYTCTGCGGTQTEVLYATGSEGLEYKNEFDGMGNHYIVTGLGSCTDSDVVIPAYYKGVKVTRIAEEAFKDATSLTSIRIPDTVNLIWAHAFAGCTGLTEMTIPAGVKNISTNIFSGCTQLHTVYYNSTYANPDNKILGIPSIKKVVFGGEYISGSMCSYLENIEQIVILDSVAKINDWAFSHCSNLSSVTFEGKAIQLGAAAFAYCNGLTSFTLPEGVTDLGDNLFDSCKKLTTLTIPASVSKIGNWIIKGCDQLTDIHFSGTKAQWNAIEKSSDWNAYSGSYTIHCTDGDISK